MMTTKQTLTALLLGTVTATAFGADWTAGVNISS